tara:strand:+ start:312 stop:584 length:273 start_codon:yes stop_codon:yes gene_type:complete
LTEGGKKEEYSYPDPNDDDMEWWAETRLNIRDVRSLYSSIDYYQSIWPGAPTRPEGEKKFLEGYKDNLYRMITDYNFTHHVVEDPTVDDT